LYNPELVDGILKYFGMEEENRRIFIDSLRDWIDEDDLVRLNGAEKEYYEKLGYQPRNRPLSTLDEITLVKGMENSIYNKIKPFLFLGKSEGLNPNVAPFEVLMSLPNMTEEGAKRIILYRKNMYIGNVTSLSSVSGIDFFLYERLFSLSLGHNLLLKATSELGEKNEYKIYCYLIKKYGPQLNIIDFVSEIKADETERWNPFEILYWKEQIE
jgi:general secretion pathway protein K